MKNIKLLLLAIIYTGSLYAQKTKVQTAWNFLKYDQLDKAKEAIDDASVNEQSINMEKTWYYRGLIYQRIFKHEKYANLDPQPLQKAYEYYQKSLELNPRSEFVDSIKLFKTIIVNNLSNAGIEQYNAKNYSAALESFESVLKMIPSDTATILNAAYSAEKSGNKEKAKKYYQSLIDMNYADAKIYVFLSNILKAEGDTAKALTIIQNGRKLFPEDKNLAIEELNFYLYSGKSREAIEPLNQAIAKDGGNANLFFARGSIFDKLNETDKAKADYNKAIELKPDYFDAYYNMGAMFFNQGAELANKANAIPPGKTKEYDEAKKKADNKFKESQPFLEKALELNPTDRSTLLSLKQLYARLGDTVKYEKIKAALDTK
ncbi:MAG: tetratricopeptide repeat protein [Bacteroidia bacterium]